MVNTNDFRRYSYTYDAAYAVDAFNQTRSSAAPDVRREKEKKRKLTLSPNIKLKSREEVKADEKRSFLQAVKICVVTVLAASMLFGVLFTYVQKNELTKSIASIKKDISAAQSENVSLNSELEALVSVSQIDSYAVEKLGMTRVQDNNVKYIDSAEYDAAQSAQNSDTEYYRLPKTSIILRVGLSGSHKILN